MVREVDLDYMNDLEQHGLSPDIEETKKHLFEKYNSVLGHMDLVAKYCRNLAGALIDEGDFEGAHNLIIASQTHDHSKLFNDEWVYLCEYQGGEQSPEVKKAVYEHVHNNNHHPEFHEYKGGIHAMDETSLQELVADWQSRADEFGIPIIDFLRDKGFKKYGFTEDSPVFHKIQKYYYMMTSKRLT